MYLFCPKCNETLEYGGSVFSQEAIQDKESFWLTRAGWEHWRLGKGLSYLTILRDETSRLNDFLQRHKDCPLVINNERGEQLWPKNLEEQSHYDKTGEIRTGAQNQVDLDKISDDLADIYRTIPENMSFMLTIDKITNPSFREMCEIIAFTHNLEYGNEVTGREIFESHPTGELYWIPDEFEISKALLRKSKIELRDKRKLLKTLRIIQAEKTKNKGSEHATL